MIDTITTECSEHRSVGVIFVIFGICLPGIPTQIVVQTDWCWWQYAVPIWMLSGRGCLLRSPRQKIFEGSEPFPMRANDRLKVSGLLEIFIRKAVAMH